MYAIIVTTIDSAQILPGDVRLLMGTLRRTGLTGNNYVNGTSAGCLKTPMEMDGKCSNAHPLSVVTAFVPTRYQT